MKTACTKDVTITLTLNEMEAVALAQLCVTVGGTNTIRREFYHEVWRRIRQHLGDVPDTNGAFQFTTKGIDCMPEDAMRLPSESVTGDKP